MGVVPMSKRYIVLVVMVGLVVLVLAAPGYGAAKKKHQCTSTSIGAHISGGFPNVLTGDVIAGLVDMKCDGGKTRHGVVEAHATVTSADPTSPPQIETTSVSYFEGGTLKLTYTGKITPQPDGSLASAGEFKITGGTGVFKGATGSGTASTSAAQLPFTSLQSKGTITY